MPSNATPSNVSPDSRAPKRETSDHSPRNVLIIAASATALIFFSLAVSGISAGILARHRAMQSTQPLGLVAAPNLYPLTRFPRPNLDLDDDHSQMIALRAAQNDRLNSYGWLDRSNGLARIPITRAMDLILQRGLPTRTNGNAAIDGSPLQLIQHIPVQP